MIGRIVEVADDHRELRVHHGHLLITDSTAPPSRLGSVPLDDILAVISHARDVTVHSEVCVALAARAIPLVVCDAAYMPVALLLGLHTHHVQASRIEAQASATRPMRKRLWARVVRAKLGQQAAVLEAIGANASVVKRLAGSVRSGDPDNLEGQAARRYWPLLFGPQFRRRRDDSGINAFLNYGYAVARAGMARAVVAAGLHPSLGLHHSHDGNAMRLVDDLIEPFRPLIDVAVWELVQRGESELTPTNKRVLVGACYQDITTDAGQTPVFVAMQRLAISLAQVLTGARNALDLPASRVSLGSSRARA